MNVICFSCYESTYDLVSLADQALCPTPPQELCLKEVEPLGRAGGWQSTMMPVVRQFLSVTGAQITFLICDVAAFALSCALRDASFGSTFGSDLKYENRHNCCNNQNI